jgi:chitinase
MTALAPWFQPGGRWGGGGYLKVEQTVGSAIDWYNIQFYNRKLYFVLHSATATQIITVIFPEGTSEYTDCKGLLTQSSSAWPKTSLFEIAASGVSQNKLIIGKPATQSSATNGYIAPSTLAGCVSQAKNKGWNGGVMVWEVCTDHVYIYADVDP